MKNTESEKELWKQHFEHISLNYPNEAVVRFFAKLRKNRKDGEAVRILDWGCATGRHTVLGCDMGLEVIAVDYVELCVEKTRKKVEEECTASAGKVVDYIVNQHLDIEEIADESLNAILAWGVIFLNTKDDQLTMMKNMYRMLKPGGRVFCDFRTQKDSVFLSKDVEVLSGISVELLSLDELKEMFGKAGFMVETIETCEFTENNQKRVNSYWHVTLLKS